MRKVLILIALLSSLLTYAESDSLEVARPRKEKREGGFMDRVYQVVKKFSEIDTNYIEPQHYNYTVKLQGTYSYESYSLSDTDGDEITLSPDPTVKVGPYFGWRWIFLGYTLDFSHVNDGKKRQDFNVSLYSSQIGVDLFYRKTGIEYKIKSLSLGGYSNESIKNVPFDGFHSSIKGFNLYYIFNHRKFSYPAAFSQSTCQKRSCGSLLAGIGYTKHTLEMNAEKLTAVVKEHFGEHTPEGLDEMESFHVEYTDISGSVGYAYNWVFARNCLFAASLSAALGYKRTKGETSEENRFSLSNFSFKNFNIDGIGRFGLVWNNTRWYAGANAIFHTYNYEKSQFATNSMFGNVNVYVGFNFGQR